MSSEDEDSSITISNKKTLITLPENSNKLTYSMNQFIPKVIIENFPSKRDVMYILKTIFKENNFPEDYTIEDNDNNTFIVNFDNEEAAMSFTKKLNLERIKNPTYKETIVTLTLVPNHHYVPEKKVKKKKGLPIDSIERLFKGESILNKSNQNTPNKKIDKKIYISRNSPNYQNSVPSNILFFLTFFFLAFGISLNSNILRKSRKDINKPTEHIFPKNYQFREIHKERWISPSNFIV